MCNLTKKQLNDNLQNIFLFMKKNIKIITRGVDDMQGYYSYTLYRVLHHRIRYYRLKIYKNLFGEYILERIYGSLKNKNATGRSIEYFKEYQEAYLHCSAIITKKRAKGYSKTIETGVSV